MTTELNYRMALLRQAEYVRQAEQHRRLSDALRTRSVLSPPGRIRRLLTMEPGRPVAVSPAPPVRAHGPLGCDG
ncbi:MAG TPA: hypothetical protein VNV17_15220 [Solirubrobacteraceae bacterium]|jgi:hypothetical protein|nr:hypothetical protein [Solirubrobacteraceae bacterium]